MSGEVHYFRLDPAVWADRLDQAVATGVTAVATYIPWVVHEKPDGTFDLGERHPHLDVGRFLDLCAERGLAVIARPGPFVMVELKNEGIGYAVVREHPEIRRTGWDGVAGPEGVVDYLHPAFLAAARRWYEAVLPLLAARLPARGGAVVGVQLDNEVGMLPWVTNTPDLSDAAVADLVADLVAAEGPAAVAARYGLDPAGAAAWGPALRSPSEDVVLALHRDLGRWTRRRDARYVRVLAGWCRELGVTGVPLLVNVHGSSGGTASEFPLGISQLSATWAGADDVIPGSDLYVGDLTLDKLPGWWAAHAFLAATTGPRQPFGALELEVGSGDYGEALAPSSGPEAGPMKLQMALAQGATVLNCYLLAGGRNPVLPEPVGDGNDRIAHTGERHGFAAPIDPEGHLSPDHAPLARIVTAVREQGDLLRRVRPETPPVALGFVPDHYMTEFRYPPSAREAAFVADLERYRGSGPREVMTRALVTGGYAPDAVDVQNGTLPTGRVLALAPTPFLDDGIQARLVAWVRAGGRLLLHGPLPLRDMLDRPATTLVDALGLTVGRTSPSGDHEPLVRATPTSRPFVVPERLPDGAPVWDVAEVAVDVAQPLTVGPGATVLARLTHGGAPCAVDLPLGAGRVVAITADLPCLPAIWTDALDRLGARPAVQVQSTVRGVVVVPAAAEDGTRVVHVMNVSPWPARVALARDGRDLLREPLALPGRVGAWLVQRPDDPVAEVAHLTRVTP
ncbi:beta-galactosidase [Cellulomonas triticagri]|uniref:beta-galactosidase n=1 Tax=Cellulomonas triticagri TaxID=2483352 RepID=UPI0011C383CB|nr:beta-galactosidase [Cellulomonas triticagri]